MPPPVKSAKTSKSGGSIVRNVINKRNPVSAQDAMSEIPSHEAPLVLKTAIPAKANDKDGEEGSSGEMPEDKDEIIMADGSRRVRRRKKKLKREKSKTLLIFVIVWISIITAVFYLFKSGEESNEEKEVGPGDQESIIAARDRLFLGQHFPRINQSFRAFLGQVDSGRRLQFIDHSARLSLQFNRFYRSAVFPRPVGEIGPVGSNVIDIKAGPDPVLGMETIWRDEEGNLLETVHVHDGEGWKLDWEAFGPYSTSPWILFASQSDRSEGTFRLYIRKMNSVDDSERFYVKFYPPPTFGEKEKKVVGREVDSPEVEIDSKSEIGQQLIEIFQNQENENEEEVEHLLGSIFPRFDPDGYVRVTVKLSWETDEKGDPELVLKELVSPSWYGQRIVEEWKEGISEGESDSEAEGELGSEDATASKKKDKPENQDE